MASENQGTDNNLPDLTALWNGSEGYAFPIMPSEASHSGTSSDRDPLSFFQLQSFPPLMGGNLHGETFTNYVGHSSSDNLSCLMSNVTQDNAIPSCSALNGRQSYDLNHNMQLQEIPPGIHSIIQLDNNRMPVNIGGQRNNFSYGHSGAPPLDISKLDGRFLCLGQRSSAGFTLESYASARDYNVNRLSSFPFGQEIHHDPLIDDGAYGSRTQNPGPSGNIGCVTLSHNNNGTLAGQTSGFDVSPSLPSSGQLIEVNQFVPPTNDRSSLVMENHKYSRYIDPGCEVYRTVAPGLYTNCQSGSSESARSSISRFPSDDFTTRIRQKLNAEENLGINFINNDVLPFQSPTHFPTVGISSCGMDQLNLDVASQETILRAPTSESLNVLPIAAAADQAFSSSIRSKLIKDSNVAHNNPLKRGPSSIVNVTPRKLMRQHIVGPSHLHVNPAQPQGSVLKITTTPPAFSNCHQQVLHPTSQSPIQTTPHQNSRWNTVPSIIPLANDRSLFDSNSSTIPASQQNFVSNSTNAYPNSSVAFTNITQSPQQPTFASLAQTTHLQKISTSMEHPCYHFSPVSHKQNPLERLALGSGAPNNVPCSPSTYSPKIVPQPSVGATRNSIPSSNHTAPDSLAISAKKSPVVPVASTKTGSSTTWNRLGVKYSVIQRFIERQSHALAAFGEKLSPDSSSETTSSTPHIKWQQGLDKQEPRGLKCQLCKRDLVYKPEGPVSIPAIPPEVAVLPCGHVFHDHCLQGITPQDQRASPPCIPCSIGEPCVRYDS